MAQATATRIPSLEEWHALRDWAVKEFEKRREDAERDEPLYSRTRTEARAALRAAEAAYKPFLAIF